MNIKESLLKKGLTVENENGKWLVFQNITTISFYDLEGSIQEAIEYLQRIKLPAGFESIQIKSQSKQYEDGEELVAFAMRNATQEEILLLDKDKNTQDQQSKEWRRKQYESLRKEFDCE